MSKVKKIVLTGGGTAGHVTPNIALLPELEKQGYDVHYIGSYEGIELILESLEKAKTRLKANVNFDLVMELLFLTIKEN